MDPETVWQDRYRCIARPSLQNSCTGFNANIDVVIPVTEEFIRSELLAREEFSELRFRLFDSMKYCAADEWVISDLLTYRKISATFARFGTQVIGGQAGIAAVHLASLGIQEVFCMVSCAGPKTLDVLANAKVRPVRLPCGQPAIQDTVHLIFEYSPGIVPVAEGVVPRNNRFIVSPVHNPETVLFPELSTKRIGRTITKCRRAFLSGYQYLLTDAQFDAAAEQIRHLKDQNPHLAIHIECVSVSAQPILKGFLDHILTAADSSGMNENELLQFLNFLDEDYSDTRHLSPVEMVEGALRICKKTGMKRLHVHTYGYYILILDPAFASPVDSQNALLFASATAAEAAKGQYSKISEAGIKAIREIAAAYPEKEPGIMSAGTYTVVVIPSLISFSIAKTVGLGDVLSSTAFVADRFVSDP